MGDGGTTFVTHFFLAEPPYDMPALTADQALSYYIYQNTEAIELIFGHTLLKMSTEITRKSPFVLRGGGEMGQLVRDKDWNQTPLGPPEAWPQSLKTTLSILLNSRFPMFLMWGPELICFYNDTYRPSLGQHGKHPSILGTPAQQAWPEIWDSIKPLIDQVLAGGEATWSENQLLPIFRNGNIEDVYWTFSYSAVEDEAGQVAGVLVACSETTDEVNYLRQLEESEASFRLLADSMPQFVWSGDRDGNLNYFNQSVYQYSGLSPEVINKQGWLQIVHPPCAGPTSSVFNFTSFSTISSAIRSNSPELIPCPASPLAVSWPKTRVWLANRVAPPPATTISASQTTE